MLYKRGDNSVWWEDRSEAYDSSFLGGVLYIVFPKADEVEFMFFDLHINDLFGKHIELHTSILSVASV